MSKQPDLMELMNRDEPLNPELMPWVQDVPKLGRMLNNPLVQELFINEKKAAFVNYRYIQKKEAVEKALKDGDVSSYIWLHERPYRLQALIEFYNEAEHIDWPKYWKAVGDVWIDSENIWQNKEEWESIWGASGDKAKAMDAAERKKLKSLKFPLTIYRGYSSTGEIDGLSWTLSKDKAIWFAKRLLSKNHKAHLATATLHNRSDVDALFTRRGEDEIVTRYARNIEFEELK